METLKAIAVSVAGVIVFGSICEMLLPDGTYKKYILLAIGLMLICTVISPFVGNRFYQTEAELPDVFDEQTVSVSSEDRQNEEIVRIYKQKLCDSIYKKLSVSVGTNLEVRCEISDEDESFGSITHLYLTASADGKAIDSNEISFIKREYGLTDEMITIKYVKDLTNR